MSWSASKSWFISFDLNESRFRWNGSLSNDTFAIKPILLLRLFLGKLDGIVHPGDINDNPVLGLVSSNVTLSSHSLLYGCFVGNNSDKISFQGSKLFLKHVLQYTCTVI